MYEWETEAAICRQEGGKWCMLPGLRWGGKGHTSCFVLQWAQLRRAKYQVSETKSWALQSRELLAVTPHMQGSPSGFAFTDILTKVSALALHRREGQSQTQ